MTSAHPTSSALRFPASIRSGYCFRFSFLVNIGRAAIEIGRFADADIGWHIRTGELITATYSLPRSDPFSSTMQGQPWFAWEWLYDVLLRGSSSPSRVRWSGVAVRLAGSWNLYLSPLAAHQARHRVAPAVLLMLLAEAASTIHLYARPYIVSSLFSLVWFVALDRWEGWEVADRGNCRDGSTRSSLSRCCFG